MELLRVLAVCLFCLTYASSRDEPLRGQSQPTGTAHVSTASGAGLPHKYSDGKSCTWVHYNCSSLSTDVAEQLIEELNLSLLKAETDLSNPNNYPPQYNPQSEESFDFIVVGAGSAGAVVANRLTEISSWSVLLLEVGGNPPKASEVPAFYGTVPFTDVDWKYTTHPNESNCLGMVNKTCKWPRGKVLGGSSTINFMLYVRGNAQDYDNWAKAGNTGWSYDDVLPYFKKSEDMRAAEVLATQDAERYHSTGGNLKVESWVRTEIDDLMNVYTKGMEEVGYPYNPDCNGKTQKGFTRTQGTLQDGRRCSTAKAFLSNVKDRQNLKVSKYSLVTKILIDKDTSRAYGVQFINPDGNIVQVKATKEVILSAGAINSPKLLMLSGVGPRQHLSDLGIPLVKHLPVGENLQDHLLMAGLALAVNFSLPSSSPVQSMHGFLMNRTSRLSSIGSVAYAGFINSVEDVDYPDVEILQGGFEQNNTHGLIGFLTLLGYRDDIIKEFIKVNEKGFTFVLLGSLLRPFSRGKIMLNSSDPTVKPTIVSGYFSDGRDIETFIRVYDFIARFAETKSMQSLNAKLYEIRVSDCEKHNFPSLEYRECALRHFTTSTYHFCGSCKMGPSEDPGAVVDPTLSVVGITGLRVVDASVIPTIVSGHLNAPVIMIAEKASDLIKQSWLK